MASELRGQTFKSDRLRLKSQHFTSCVIMDAYLTVVSTVVIWSESVLGHYASSQPLEIRLLVDYTRNSS
jgi:hypothetical protein